jgi:hypothetical protein
MKNSGAGYGKETIDLAAPGTGILSTVPGNGTDSLTGTSMATPHVTGAVGFLMSVASQPFLDLHKTQPGEAALEMKRMILETVTKTEQFEDMTVSGGILNLKKAADAISIYGLPTRRLSIHEKGLQTTIRVVCSKSLYEVAVDRSTGCRSVRPSQDGKVNNLAVTAVGAQNSFHQVRTDH